MIADIGEDVAQQVDVRLLEHPLRVLDHALLGAVGLDDHDRPVHVAAENADIRDRNNGRRVKNNEIKACLDLADKLLALVGS